MSDTDISWFENDKAGINKFLIYFIFIVGMIFGIVYCNKVFEKSRVNKIAGIINEALIKEHEKAKNEVYKEAMEAGAGKWVIIDNEGHTKFEWIRND
jgi:hypothetical protein